MLEKPEKEVSPMQGAGLEDSWRTGWDRMGQDGMEEMMAGMCGKISGISEWKKEGSLVRQKGREHLRVTSG